MPETKHIDDEGFILDETVRDIIMTRKPDSGADSGNHALAKAVPGAVLLESFSGDIIFPAPAPGAPERLSVLESPVVYIPCAPTDGSDEAIIGQFEDLFDSAGIAFPDDFPWLEHIVRLVGTNAATMLDKMLAIQEESQQLGEFLEWLQTRYAMFDRNRRRDADDVYVDVTGPGDYIDIEKTLAEYFGIDLAQAEKEKRDLLAHLRNG